MTTLLFGFLQALSWRVRQAGGAPLPAWRADRFDSRGSAGSTARSVVRGNPWFTQLLVGLTLLPTLTSGSTLSEAWRWAAVGSEAGLPSGMALDVVETTDGVVWAGTDVGVAWFDGFRWKPAAVPGHATLGADSQIVANLRGGILLISRGQLFQGDRQGFVQLMVEKDGAPLWVGSVVPVSPGELLITALADRHQLDSSALYRLHQRTLEVFPMPTTVSELWKDAALFRTRKGTVWLSHRNGLFEWVGSQWLERFPMAASYFGGDEEGFATWATVPPSDPAIWSWKQEGSPSRRPTEGRDVIALDVAPGGDAAVVYATGEVEVRRNGDWLPASLPADIGRPRFVRFQANGDLWLGSERGLYCHRGSSQRWSSWSETQRDRISAILQTRGGDVWVGTERGVVVRRKDGFSERIPAVGTTKLHGVTGLAEDREGGIWVTSGGGIAGAFRRHQGTWRHFGESEGLVAPHIHKIVPDRQGRLWFLGLAPTHQGMATEREPGAFVYDEGVFTAWEGNDGLLSGRVYDFAEGPNGEYWFGTLAGLSRRHRGNWTHWTPGEGLKARKVFTVAVGSRGELCFAHQSEGGGLGCIDNNGSLQTFTQVDGLIDDHVRDLQFAADGTLWISTARGLAGYRDGHFFSFGTNDGLVHPRLWPLLPLEDRVYVGTLGRGLQALHLDEIAHPAPRVDVLAPLYTADRVLFRWQAFPFRGQRLAARTTTRYRLDQGPWSDWTTARKTTVLGLQPGEHTFVVQAKGLSGEVSSPGTAVSFPVPWPFYRHPLTLFGLGIWALMAAGFALVSLRRRRRHKGEMRGERQAAEETLRQSEERLRSITANSPDYIMLLDLDWKLQFVNRTLPELTTDQVIGRQVFKWAPPEQVEKAEKIFEQVAETGRPQIFESSYQNQDGEVLWFESRVARIEQNGEAVGVVVNSRDITARRKADEALRQAQKMEAIGRLAGGVAHDFNNLLTVILGHAELAKSELDGSSPSVRESLDDILKASFEAGSLTKQLLAFSRQQEVRRQVVHVNTVVGEAERLVRRLLREDIQVITRLDPELGSVRVDPSQLQQLILNLAVNAQDAMPAGGRLTIETSNMRAADPVGDAKTHPDGLAMISVSDTGCGMDEKTRSRIFDPFFTTKGVGKGTGLGLSTVYGIVEQNDGEIEVSTAPNAGSVFRVLFPSVPQEGVSSGKETRPSPERIGCGTVLVVDDKPDVLRAVEGALTLRGFHTLTLGPYLEEPGGMSSRVWRRRWIAGLLWIRAFEGSRSGGGRGQLRPSYGI